MAHIDMLGRRAAPRDGCPSGKRRNASGAPRWANEGRIAQGAKFTAGDVAGHADPGVARRRAPLL